MTIQEFENAHDVKFVKRTCWKYTRRFSRLFTFKKDYSAITIESRVTLTKDDLKDILELWKEMEKENAI